MHQARNSRFAWLLLFIILLFIRAWPRLVQPEVWNEDAVIVSGWIKHGLPSLTHTINGYLILVPRLVSGLALIGPFTNYPAISTYIAWIITIAICAFVAFTPSRLEGTKWIVVVTLLIPSDPETFGLPLYLLWWSAILLFVLLFWARDGKFVRLRVTLLALASLSSPVCLALLPANVLRGVLLREHKGELVVAASATVFSLMQLYAMWPLASQGTLSFDDLLLIPQKFLGSYLVGNLVPTFETFAGIIGAALLLSFFAHNRNSWTILGLAYLWAASILMSIARVDIHIIHQTLAGPRYFFFPYILISWILVQAVFIYKQSWQSWLAICLLLLGAANAAPNLWRTHANLEWRKHAYSCAHFRNYDLPVHFDGSLDRQWHLRLNGQECAKLIGPREDHLSYPYRRVAIAEKNIQHSVRSSALLDSNWTRSNESEGISPLIQEFVLLQPSSALRSTITLRVTQGQVILLRPEAMDESTKILIEHAETRFYQRLPNLRGWIALEFSNKNLPREFVVKISATASPTLAISAIALKP